MEAQDRYLELIIDLLLILVCNDPTDCLFYRLKIMQSEQGTHDIFFQMQK